MKYLLLFQTSSDYNSAGGGLVTPNVCYIEKESEVVFNPYIPPVEPEVEMISFSIVNGTFQAEKGMTWEEWINSNYCNISLYLWPDGHIYNSDYNESSSSSKCIYKGSIIITSKDVIENNGVYVMDWPEGDAA